MVFSNPAKFLHFCINYFLNQSIFSCLLYKINRKNCLIDNFWVFSKISREISNFLTDLCCPHYVWIRKSEKVLGSKIGLRTILEHCDLGEDQWTTSLHCEIFEVAAGLLESILWDNNFRTNFEATLGSTLGTTLGVNFGDNFGDICNFQLQKCNFKTSEVYHDGGGWVKIDEWRVFITRSLSQASSKKCSFIILEGNLCCLTEIEIVTLTSMSYYYKNESTNDKTAAFFHQPWACSVLGGWPPRNPGAIILTRYCWHYFLPGNFCGFWKIVLLW